MGKTWVYGAFCYTQTDQKNRLKLSRQQTLRAYCSTIYTLSDSFLHWKVGYRRISFGGSHYVITEKLDFIWRQNFDGQFNKQKNCIENYSIKKSQFQHSLSR